MFAVVLTRRKVMLLLGPPAPPISLRIVPATADSAREWGRMKQMEKVMYCRYAGSP
jgi:hypothetical protein